MHTVQGIDRFFDHLLPTVGHTPIYISCLLNRNDTLYVPVRTGEGSKAGSSERWLGPRTHARSVKIQIPEGNFSPPQKLVGSLSSPHHNFSANHLRAQRGKLWKYSTPQYPYHTLCWAEIGGIGRRSAQTLGSTTGSRRCFFCCCTAPWVKGRL